MKSIYLVRGILSNMLNWRTRSFKYNVALREEIFSNQEVLNILSHIKKKYNKIDTLLKYFCKRHNSSGYDCWIPRIILFVRLFWKKGGKYKWAFVIFIFYLFFFYSAVSIKRIIEKQTILNFKLNHISWRINLLLTLNTLCSQPVKQTSKILQQ